MVLLFVLSSQSGLRVSEDADIDRPLRVLAHLMAFAVLGAALLFALCDAVRPSARNVLVAFTIAVLFGLSDEIHQAFVPDRTGQLQDLVVDTIGAAIGVAAAWSWLRWRSAAGRRR